MNRATLSTLPEDVLEEIFRKVGEGGEDKLVETFRPFCLVNRSLLSVARRHLYAAPLARSWKYSTPANTRKLISSLQAKAVLSALVRSFLPVQVRFQLDRPAFDEGVTFPILRAILNACPRLKEIHVAFSSSSQVEKVVHALRPSRSTLSEIKISSSYWREGSWMGLAPTLVDQFLDQLEMDDLETLHLADIGGEHLRAIPSRVKNLILELYDIPSDHISCLPAPPTTEPPLKELNLGVVPVETHEAMVDFERALRVRRVKLQYDAAGCTKDQCEVCERA
ncbi:hypothetical protein JCM8547_000741 [Rhodosporidiobolus lusitaniae]